MSLLRRPHTMRPTRRQDEMLAVIKRCMLKYGLPPTVREIGKQMGITSTNGVSDHLRALERKGLLRRSGDGRSRGIQLVGVDNRCPLCGALIAEAPAP